MERPDNLNLGLSILAIKASDDPEFPYLVDYVIEGVSSGLAFFHTLDGAIKYFEGIRDTLWPAPPTTIDEV